VQRGQLLVHEGVGDDGELGGGARSDLEGPRLGRRALGLLRHPSARPAKNLSVISLYAPSGSSGDHRQESKWRFLDSFMLHLQSLRRKRREFIICGDWNIAHQNIDLKNWRSNQKNSGFLPEERAWLSDLFDRVGFVDGFREVDKREEQYTWWSNRGQSWDKNVGWRIDYQIVTPELRNAIQRARIYRDQRFSDHAPLIMDYDFELA
jgi:exodeoxyribonuclease-3